MNDINAINLNKIFEKDFIEVSDDFLQSVMQFTFLWMCFEKKFISEQNVGKNKQIAKFTSKYFDKINNNQDVKSAYVKCSMYFHGRYQDSEKKSKLGDFTSKIPGRSNITQVHINTFIGQKYNPDNAITLECCLQIIYKLRCNLFHGTKWSLELDGQIDNFRQANNLLYQINLAFMSC